MKSLNFLFAIKDMSGDVRFVQSLKERLVTGINEQGYCQVGHFDFAFNKESLVEKMKSNMYDVVLCNEELGADKIGVGSLRSWKGEYPHIRVILLIGNARKGNIKLIQLIQKLEYTDVLYMGDMNGKSICDLLENPRSLKDAVYYYGIEESPDIISMGILDKTDSMVEETVEEETSATEVVEESLDTTIEGIMEEVVEETGAAEAKEEISDTSLEDAIKAFEDFSEFEEEAEEETPAEETKADSSFHFDIPFPEEEGTEVGEDSDTKEQEVVAEEEVEGFNFFDIPMEEDVVTYKEVAGEEDTEEEPELINIENVEFEEEEEVGGFATEVVEEIVTEEVAPKETGEPKDIFEMPFMENVSRGGVMVRTQTEQILSASGYITQVVDEDSLLVELDTDLIGGNELQSYRLLIRIKSGRKGVMENGRYRSANLSLEAYVECMVGQRTAMVEVMDFDCLTNSPVLENKECTIILTRM